ncbi:uncharacterized protein LOC143645049 [Tamandua tetradactyla]|uniref:uncharacterized protein LOC143645049 n=1 Tax=Tamandua tetradactyla TaxID=48850 RepID=UPI00405454A0
MVEAVLQVISFESSCTSSELENRLGHLPLKSLVRLVRPLGTRPFWARPPQNTASPRSRCHGDAEAGRGSTRLLRALASPPAGPNPTFRWPDRAPPPASPSRPLPGLTSPPVRRYPAFCRPEMAPPPAGPGPARYRPGPRLPTALTLFSAALASPAWRPPRPCPGSTASRQWELNLHSPELHQLGLLCGLKVGRDGLFRGMDFHAASRLGFPLAELE